MSIGDISTSHCDDVRDVVGAMLQQEERMYRLRFDADELVIVWRRILVEWMYFVVDHCQLQREAVGAAAFFLDVAMSRKLVSEREEHQLAAASALQLALKLFDSTVIRIEKLVKLGRGLFTKEDVARMEYKILESMKWHLHPPSTYCFMRQYERLFPSSVSESTLERIHAITKLVSELTVVEHKYTRYSASVVAYATILMALELLHQSDMSIRQRQCFVLHMSLAVKLDSSSEKVLHAFEDLKETLDSSSKLETLMTTLASLPKGAAEDVSQSPSNDIPTPKAIQSPRQVMARLGSSLSCSSPVESSLRL